MKLLFWNTHNNTDINEYILNLVEEYQIDIIILAEYNSDMVELDGLLYNSSKSLYRWSTIGCERLKIWGNYIDIQPGEQHKYFSVQVINNKYIVCGVHLFSNLNGERNLDRVNMAQNIMGEIEQVKNRINSDRVVLCQDLVQNKMRGFAS